jgi:cell division protein FtsA
MQDIKVILDIGNGWIKGAVFGLEDGVPIIIAKDIIKTKGMRKGKVLDQEEFSLCINDILDTFAKKLWGNFVDEVYIGISHPDCNISRVSESKRILNKTVEGEDIWHLSQVLMESAGKANYEVLKIVPVQWIIDDETKVKDPIDMEARKLELIADVFQIPKNFYNNLLEACARLDLKVIDVVPNILWASEAVLDAESKDLGVLLIDIWANQTSYVIYEEGVSLTYGILPIGWEDVTKDISIGLQLDINEAERIKREQGVIELNNKLGHEDGIDKGFLNDIMIARYEEIFENIQNHLIHIKRDGRLAGGVYLTGWGSKVENLLQLTKNTFRLASFSAKERILRITDTSENPQMISLLWLYTRTNKYHQAKKKGFGIKGMKMDFSWMSKIGDFLKQLF